MSDEDEPVVQPFTTELRDGTEVLLRPLEPRDRERLAAGFEQLSPEDRYQRFHTTVLRLTERDLDYLTDVDQHHHLAWVALDLDDPDEAGVGVARAIRLPDEPRTAEAALTVAPAYRGRGAGTLLLGVLARAAMAEGIEVFRNYVLVDNRRMVAVLDELGAERELEAPGVLRVDLRLPTGEVELPESGAGQAFLAAARGELELGSLHPPVWRAARTEPPASSPDLTRWLARRHGESGAS